MSSRGRNLQTRRHTPWVAAALVVYIGCAALVMGADAWDPLGRWGWGLLALGSLALGLIDGRWRMLVCPVALLALAPLTRAPEPALFFIIALPVLAILSAALIAVGVWLRARLRRREEADRRAALAGVALLGLASVLTGWGVYLDQRVVDNTPSEPLLIDERSGAFRGIAPGAPTAQARRVLGKPVLGAFREQPLGADPDDLSGPSSLPVWQSWRYRRLVLFTSRGRVRGYLTTDPSAQTPAGVGVGDSLAVAERRQRKLDCYGVTVGSDSVNPSYPACEARLPGGGQIFFGGDPIDSIWVSERDSDF